jgi:hypothetical protein
MGSNPILAAIYQGNYRATPVARLARGRQLLPDFYRLCVAVGGGVALVVLKRMHVDARLRGLDSLQPLARRLLFGVASERIGAVNTC